MHRTMLTLAAVLAATAANAQQSFHPMNKPPVDPEAGLPAYQRKYMPPPDPIGDVPPGWTLSSAHPLVVLPPRLTPEPVVMYGGMGGLISAHQERFALLKRNNATVEMRGGCWSACTMITGYIPKDRLCFGQGAFLAFHAAQTGETPHRLNPAGTWTMYWSYPAEIQTWVDANGGPLRMTIEDYWFLRDVELWKMGYPRCK
jgi:hypothetical protein